MFSNLQAKLHTAIVEQHILQFIDIAVEIDGKFIEEGLVGMGEAKALQFAKFFCQIVSAAVAQFVPLSTPLYP